MIFHDNRCLKHFRYGQNIRDQREYPLLLLLLFETFAGRRPSRIFYLTGYMTNLYPFIQGSLERPFSELFSSDVSLWKQYKYIAFNIFSFTILIVSYKMLMITGISNENTNELNIYAILCRKVTIFYRQKLASLFQVQKKLKACRNSK